MFRMHSFATAKAMQRKASWENITNWANLKKEILVSAKHQYSSQCSQGSANEKFSDLGTTHTTAKPQIYLRYISKLFSALLVSFSSDFLPPVYPTNF